MAADGPFFNRQLSAGQSARMVHFNSAFYIGARAHGEIRWVHLYYALGFLHWAGLREPLQKHQQSVLPALERKGTGERYRQANAGLTGHQFPAGSGSPPAPGKLLFLGQYRAGHKSDAPLIGLPTSSLPQDTPVYARGYLDQRRILQAKRPPPPAEAGNILYHWDYHLGRLMPWKGAGNDPKLGSGFQLGLADQRELEKAILSAAPTWAGPKKRA